MGIEDIPRIGKAIKAAKAAKALENADDVIHPVLILEREGVEYEFRNMSFRQADQIWFSKIKRAQVQGTEEKVDLPSELPKERQEVLEAETNPPSAEIIPFKQKPTAPVFDNEAMGVPIQMEPDFTRSGGFTKKMTPNEFEQRTPDTRGYSPHIFPVEVRQGLVDRLKKGEPIPQPYVRVTWNESNKQWEMYGHEGRHRMAAIGATFGKDAPVDVQVIPIGIKASEITDEMRKAPIVGVASAAGVEVTNNETKEPKKLEPGIYLDEDSGKYYKITKDGDLEELDK